MVDFPETHIPGNPRRGGHEPAEPFDPREALRILGNPRATPRTIRALCEQTRYHGSYDVRAAIVLHPSAPLAMALRLLPTLYRRDLARVVDDVRLAPPVRCRAEQILAERLGEMTTGEQITLARVASRTLVKSLRASRDALVIAALLGNRRLVEEDVVAIAGDENGASQVLAAIARSARWAQSYAVKIALAQNPHCPVMDSLRALRGLLDRDLRSISENPAVPRLVRVGASRRLRESAGEGR